MRLKFMLAGIALATMPGIAAAQAQIDGTDPKVTEQQLREMGYSPERFEVGTASATTILHFPGETLGLVLGGCTEGKACTYAALAGAFTDVKNAPPDWVSKVNIDYDLIKVWTREDGSLAYGAATVITGMARATFKAWVDLVKSSIDALGGEAIDAGLGPKE